MKKRCQNQSKKLAKNLIKFAEKIGRKKSKKIVDFCQVRC